MADAKRKKTLRKKQPKPEVVVKALPKATIAKPAKNVKPTVTKTSAKHRRRANSVKRLLGKRVRQPVFATVFSVVLLIAVVVSWAVVGDSLSKTYIMYDSAVSASAGAYSAVIGEARLLRVIGGDKQRADEIVNYQSAPVDLQKAIMSDYRLFKKKCMVNGVISGDVSYELGNVVYDAYAVARRTCNGGTDTAIYKKFSDRWSLIFEGNNEPSCILTNDLEIPQGTARYCYQDGVRYLNPNP